MSDEEIALGQWQNDPATELTIPVGNGPVFIVGDGTSIYVANTLGATVSKIDPITGTSVPISVGANPMGMAYDGSRIWVANNASDSVSVIDVATGAVTATVAVGSDPVGVAFDGTKIYVTNSGDNTVTVIDAATQVTEPTPIGVDIEPRGIVFDGTNLFVAAFGNGGGSNTGKVSVINPTTSAVTSLDVLGSPQDLVFDGARIWVSTNRGGGNASLATIDAASLLVDNDPVNFGLPIRWVGFDGRFVYATNTVGNRVYYFSPGLPRDAAQLQVGANPGDVYFDGTNIFIARKDGDDVMKLLPRR